MARGFAIGALSNFFPTFGFGIVIGGFLAGLVGGNVIAGFLGGTLFVVLWPFLFVLNMKTGGLLYHSPVQVERIEDVDEQTIDALVMGKTFLAGAVVNGLIGGLLLYAIVYFAHSQFRIRVLAWFRIQQSQRLQRRHKRKKNHRSS